MTGAHHHERGQAAIEFALTGSMILTLFFAILDLGRAVAYYNSLQNATREAARHAITHGTTTDTTGDEAYALKLEPLLDSSKVIYVETTAPYTYPVGVQVTMSYPFTPSTPLVGQFLGAFTMTVQSKMYGY